MSKSIAIVFSVFTNSFRYLVTLRYNRSCTIYHRALQEQLEYPLFLRLDAVDLFLSQLLSNRLFKSFNERRNVPWSRHPFPHSREQPFNS